MKSPPKFQPDELPENRARNASTPRLAAIIILSLSLGSVTTPVTALRETTTSSSSSCVFPDAYHGVFETQRPDSLQQTGSLDYSDVIISPDSISLWGKCVERNGNSFVLEDKVPGGSATCIRCVRVESRSANVMQIYVQASEQSRCFVTVEDARATCPSAPDQPGTSEEITLYRKNGFTDSGQESVVEKTFCPVAGRYEYIYRNSRLPAHVPTGGLPRIEECDRPTSIAANCPYGFGLTFDYHGCSFPDRRESYQCLGDWSASAGSDLRYFALVDLGAVPGSPRYRCGMYREESDTGTVLLSMATDSTCRNGLRSPEEGAETWMLKPVHEPPPREVATCVFPSWAQGKWENVEFRGGELKLREDGQFRTIKASCMQEHNARRGEMYHIYAKSQCGEDMYSCLWVKQRENNILELRISEPSSSMNWTACASHEAGVGSFWSTHARVGVAEVPSTCAVTNEYIGAVPDNPGLCVRLETDCRDHQTMSFEVLKCPNGPEPLIMGETKETNPYRNTQHGGWRNEETPKPDRSLPPFHGDTFQNRWQPTTPRIPQDVSAEDQHRQGGSRDWSQLFSGGPRRKPPGPRISTDDQTQRAQVQEVKPIQRPPVLSQNGPVPGDPGNPTRRRPPNHRRPENQQQPGNGSPPLPNPSRFPPRPIWRSKRAVADQEAAAYADRSPSEDPSGALENEDYEDAEMVEEIQFGNGSSAENATGSSNGNSTEEDLPTAKFSKYVQLYNSRSRGSDYERERSPWSSRGGLGTPYNPLEFHSRQNLQTTAPPPYDRRAPWHRAPSKEVNSDEDRGRFERPRADRWQDEGGKTGKSHDDRESSTKFAADDDIPVLEPGWSERKQKQSKTSNRVDDVARGGARADPRYPEYDLAHRQHHGDPGYPAPGVGEHGGSDDPRKQHQLPGPLPDRPWPDVRGEHGGDPNDRPPHSPAAAWRPQHPDNLPTEYKFSMVGGSGGEGQQQRNQQPNPQTPYQQQGSFDAGHWPHHRPPGFDQAPPVGNVRATFDPFTPEKPPVGDKWAPPLERPREFPPLQPERKKNPKMYFEGEKRHYKCFGRWEENGHTYAYAKRMDAPGFDCFVLRQVGDGELFVDITGTHCQRQSDIIQHGGSRKGLRFLKKEDSCSGPSPRHRQPAHPQRPPQHVPVPHQPSRAPVLPPHPQPGEGHQQQHPSSLPKLPPPRRPRPSTSSIPPSRSQTKKPGPGQQPQQRPPQAGNWNKNNAPHRAVTTPRPWKPITAGPNRSSAVGMGSFIRPWTLVVWFILFFAIVP